MFVKVYQYHIQKDKVNEFLAIQEKATKVYKQYLDYQTVYLNSKNDETKWLEISSYKNEKDYLNSIELINKQPKIQELFQTFQSLLVTDKSEILEEDFIEKFRL